MRRLLFLFPLLVVAACCQKAVEPVPAPAAPKAPDSRSALTTSSSPAKKPMDIAGVPYYPGAEVKGEGSALDSSGDTHFNVLLSTPDSVDKVVAFYKDKEKNVKASVRDKATNLIGTTANGANLILSVEPDGNATKITIRGIIPRE